MKEETQRLKLQRVNDELRLVSAKVGYLILLAMYS
jgi:hypothetical protein